MVVRWVGAAIVEAEKKFRRVKGWRDIDKLIRALEAKEQKQEAIAGALPTLDRGAAAQRSSTANGIIPECRKMSTMNISFGATW
jgi:hypothetical protein